MLGPDKVELKWCEIGGRVFADDAVVCKIELSREAVAEAQAMPDGGDAVPGGNGGGGKAPNFSMIRNGDAGVGEAGIGAGPDGGTGFIGFDEHGPYGLDVPGGSAAEEAQARVLELGYAPVVLAVPAAGGLLVAAVTAPDVNAGLVRLELRRAAEAVG